MEQFQLIDREVIYAPQIPLTKIDRRALLIRRIPDNIKLAYQTITLVCQQKGFDSSTLLKTTK